ncbi:MAG: hypothetical protein GC189_05650 [Alphaproteobacteria bacterium]|nr:hypothetical protein [Alphaproteobacteria bacterium]
MRILIAALAFTMISACAAGPARSPVADLVEMQRQLDARGIGFAVGPPPRGEGVMFTLRFRTADADDQEPITEADFRAAAEAASPEGCSVATLEPLPDGAMVATYACP